MDIINKEHYRTIRKAIENNKLAVFVGSAVSYDSNLPSWGDLITIMRNSLENPRISDYLKVAEHFYLQYGRNAYYSKINESFPSGSQPNLLHELIIGLKPQHIVTTNWDNLLEKSIENSGELYFKVASDHELASSPSSQLLIKMHGDLSHRNIIFKESDYLSYSDKFPLVENFIKSLFSTHVVLFVGYSISDYNLNQILSWIRNRTQDAPPSFTILTESTITLSELNYLREKGVYALLREEQTGASVSLGGLSNKSVGVAKTLNSIAHPEDIEAADILAEVVTDVSSWKIVYPSTLVQLIRNRLNIIRVNKIYYSPDENVISYSLSDEEKKQSRAQFRKIRKHLVNLLSHTPVAELRFSTSEKSYYRIRNLSKFEISDEYTTFNFELIKSRSASASTSLSDNLEDCFQFAFDNYYLKKLGIARESFMHVANRYFLKSNFISSLVSSFNKKQLSFGEIPWGLDPKFLEVSMQEQLSRNDNISEIIDRFPKSITSRQKPLFQGLDASNSFLLERFKHVSNLSRAIDDEIKSIKNGSMVFSNKLASMQNQARAIVLFVVKNKISVIYSSDYKNIAVIAFESIIKRMSTENRMVVDKTIIYLAVFSFRLGKLTSFLSENLRGGEGLNMSAVTFDYAFSILKNCLSEMSSSGNYDTYNHALNVWSNTLTILAYTRHNESESNALISHLVLAVDTNRWADLTAAINEFIVLQYNKYGNAFSASALSLLFETQIHKINSSSHLPIQERGTLFSNLLHLIKESKDAKSDIFKDNKEIYKFIDNVSKMELSERLRAISRFVFAIHSLAYLKLKKKTLRLLMNTFSEIKKTEFSGDSIIFSLNLELLGLLSEDDLRDTICALEKEADSHISKGSASTQHQVIKEQLLSMEKTKLKQYSTVVEKVIKLSDSIEKSFRREAK